MQKYNSVAPGSYFKTFFFLLLTKKSLLSQSKSKCMSALCFSLKCALLMLSPGASTCWKVVSRSLSSPNGDSCWIGWCKYSAPGTAGFSVVTAAIQFLISLFWSEKEEQTPTFLHLLVISQYIKSWWQNKDDLDAVICMFVW